MTHKKLAPLNITFKVSEAEFTDVALSDLFFDRLVSKPNKSHYPH